MIELSQFIKCSLRKFWGVFFSGYGFIRRVLAFFRKCLREETILSLAAWVAITIFGCVATIIVTLGLNGMLSATPGATVEVWKRYALYSFIIFSVVILITQCIYATYEQFKAEQEHLIDTLRREYK